MAETILIVEDEPKNMILFRDLLQVTGYETLEAVNGVEGVEKAKTGKPDLILMDIQLPEMDGLEATRRIKSDDSLKNIPIIAVTAFAMKGDRERIIEAGCNDYLTKPVDIKILLATVKKHLSK